MTDNAEPLADPDAVVDAHSVARAQTSDGRTVVAAQDVPGSPLVWFVPDGRTSDGWREVTDRDEVGQLVADINAHQAARQVTEDSTGGGATDPEGDAPGGEATPTAGTTEDNDG